MENESETKKKAYGSPQLTVYGSVEGITMGNQDGNFTDAAFPVNTPKSELRFS